MINTELSRFKEDDMWSFLLFTLLKLKDDRSYAALSELAYILDKDSLIKLCEYFGGLTLSIPTIDDLQNLIYGMQMFVYCEMEHLSLNQALDKLPESIDKMRVRDTFVAIKTVLSEYNFQHRDIG